MVVRVQSKALDLFEDDKQLAQLASSSVWNISQLCPQTQIEFIIKTRQTNQTPAKPLAVTRRLVGQILGPPRWTRLAV